jgi:hypothetical protein
VTTHSCLNCYEPACDKVGQDLLGCEHFVRADDIEVPDEIPDPIDMILLPMADKVDALEAEVKRLMRTVEEIVAWRDEFVAAVVKGSGGEVR